MNKFLSSVLAWIIISTTAFSADVSPPSLTTPQAAGTVLSGPVSGAAAISSFKTAAALNTSLTTPLLIGGATTTSPLNLRSTSGVGTTGADIIFQTGNNGATEAARILNSGNFGIGTTAPYAQTQVYGAGTIGGYLSTSTSGGSPIGGSLYLGDSAFNSTGYWNSAPGLSSVYTAQNGGVAGDLAFYVYNGVANTRTETMRMLNSGFVGIGKVNPATALDVSGTTTSTLFIGASTTQAAGDNSTKLATTAYVANALLGQDFKEACNVATTVLLVGTYSNGSSGVGATIIITSTGILAIDGVTSALNDRVLVKNQTSTFQNGIYTVTTAGAIGIAEILTRSTDFNQSAEITSGSSVFIKSGTTQSTTTWAYNGADAPVIGTDPITFVQTAGQGSFTAGNGISITGNSIAINTAVTVDKTTAQVITNKDMTSATNTFLVMSATVGGIVPTPPNNTTTFLRGDGTFSTPSGSGTVNSGTASQIAYYASSTNAVSGNSGATLDSSGNLAITGGGGTTTPLKLTPAARTSGSPAYFKYTIPTDTTLANNAEAPGIQGVTATRQFASGGSTIALQREVYFPGPTYTAAAPTLTITDSFNLYLDAPIAGANMSLTRPHTLGIVDSQDCPSPSNGAFVVAAALGTNATSVGIGNGNINAGGKGTFGGALVAGSTSITGAAATTALTIAQTARTSGSLPYIKYTIPTDTTLAVATEAPGIQGVTATRQWATGGGTLGLQREIYFPGPTYTAAAAMTITDSFNLYLDKPVQSTNITLTRPHTFGIVDSTSASSSITGGLVVATTLGTSTTSVGIGGGNINAGGTGAFGGALSTIGAVTFGDGSALSCGALPSGANTLGAAASFSSRQYTYTGANSATTAQVVWHGDATFSDASAGVVTDLFNENWSSGPIVAGALTAGRIHTLGVQDATSSTTSITGAVVVAATYGTNATSVGIGGGNVYAGGVMSAAAQAQTIFALTDAATVAWNMASGANASLTIGGNRTLGAPTGTTNGVAGVIVITQDGTGTRTLAYNSVWKFQGGVAPTLSTAAGAIDILAFYIVDSTHINANLTKDYR